MRLKMWTIAIVGAALLVAGGTAWGQAAANLPGITVKDPYPMGCVSCHLNEKGQDRRVSTWLAQTVQNHPNVKSLKTIPTDCMVCHVKDGTAEPMNVAMHKSHYKNGSKNGFVQFYGGSCLSCHALSQATWETTVKSGPRNW